MKVIYKRETGMIISQFNKPLAVIDGEGGHVDFPEEMIKRLHELSPGIIFELAHTHPPGIFEPSGRDKQTMYTWAFALYPFPVRLSVFSYDNSLEIFKKQIEYLERRGHTFQTISGLEFVRRRLIATAAKSAPGSTPRLAQKRRGRNESARYGLSVP